MDRDAQPFDSQGQAADELRRLDARDAAHDHGTQHARNVDPGPRLGAGDGKDAVILSPGAAMGDLGCQARHLGAVGCDHQFVGGVDVGVDPFGRGDADHLVHGALHRFNHGKHGIAPAVAGIAVVVPGKAAGQPAAVAPRGPKAREFLFQDRHAQVGAGGLEVEGGPEPGIARADDGDIGLGFAHERGATVLRETGLGIPEADLAQTGHGMSPAAV